MRSPSIVDRRIAAGIAALGLVGLLAVGALAGLASEAAGDPGAVLSVFDARLLGIVRFTLWQAVLSTVLSVVPAIAVALALSRQTRFLGRAMLVRLFAVPLALPAIVAVIGILALYGRSGPIGTLANALDAGTWPGIYGLSGILLAHVFFNMPLATRLVMAGLETVPMDHHRLADHLGLGAGARLRFIEWPAIRSALPGVAALVFMLCVTSFTIVLTLGGGPRATTLEVAIYQSLRFDFDPARAVALTLTQIGLTVVVVAFMLRLGGRSVAEPAITVSRRRFDESARAMRVPDALVIGAAALFVTAPIAMVAAAGLGADLGRIVTEAAFHRALATSLALGAVAASLAVLSALALLAARRALEDRRRGTGVPGPAERLMDGGASLVLVMPPVVLGAGWFILLLDSGAVFAAAPVMIAGVNAAMALPFVLRALRPAHDAAATRHDRLCQSLGVAGWARWRLIDWPALRRPLATAFAFAMALSLGDLGVVALFGSDTVETLPYLLYQRMGSYRTADAAGLALLLGLLCLGLMMVADRMADDERR